ncbi:MAG: glycoside hydrolase family 2 protein [Sphingobacteriaceae bacterium]|nr:glycoside hydrolase family 2 protein [Sphingobacteriaceae bacterium]
MNRLLLCTLITSIFSPLFAQKTSLSLHSGWSVQQLKTANVYKAQVPGCVQNDLLIHKKIAHPYLANQSEKIDWVAEQEWAYRKSLEISKAQLEKENIELVFEGLDTYAEVFINHVSVLKANNMFRKWTINAKPQLRLGKNEIKVIFKSTVDEGIIQSIGSAIRYPADNEIGSTKISPFIRKAPYQFGWDFAPKLLTVGIIKPVYLQTWSNAKLEPIQLNLIDLNAKKADYQALFNLQCTKNGVYNLEIIDQKSKQVLANKKIELKSQTEAINVPFSIQNPKLWWPNGLGKAHLYRLAFVVRKNGVICDQKEVKVGVRKIEVVNKPDPIGESFYVKVNDKPVFIKGSNFVPTQSLIDNQETQQLRPLFNAMQESNYNMIRVWGGGTYGSDAFYDLADEKGIMVWQDFMFACTMYPSDAEFLENVAQEATDNIQRIQNHPSLAMWCGNNEIAVGWKNWGWQKTYQYSEKDSLNLINGYDKLFKNLLPKLVKKHDKQRFYFHSSPISNWGKPEDFKKGDNHYWGIYHGEQPFEAYQSHVPRFNSEFGFQSFPSWETLQEISKNKDPKISDSVLVKRQKSYKGNQLLEKYMDWYYQKPKSFEQFVYLSQLQQAEGMKMAIESNRSAMPYNMGTLVWQQNDCWPAISWSTISHNGQWKAAQYFIKKAYQPILISAKSTKDSLMIYIVSDKQSQFTADLNLQRWTMDGENKLLRKISVQIPANGVKTLQIAKKELHISDENKEFVALELIQNKQSIASALHYFTAVKNLSLTAPKIDIKWVKKDGKSGLILRSKQLVKNVFLSLKNDEKAHFSDNYFDLLPNKNYPIEIISKQSLEQAQHSLKIRQVNPTD